MPEETRITAGNANNFWNELSSKLESNEKSLLISMSDDNETRYDSLEAMARP
jgi:hypothetical protein